MTDQPPSAAAKPTRTTPKTATRRVKQAASASDEAPGLAAGEILEAVAKVAQPQPLPLPLPQPSAGPSPLAVREVFEMQSAIMKGDFAQAFALGGQVAVASLQALQAATTLMEASLRSASEAATQGDQRDPAA